MEGMTERSNQGAPSRRAFVAGLGGATLGLLASRAPAQQASAIKRGGTFVESINWTYPSLDPHLSSQPFMAGHEAMYNTLVRYELADAKTGEQKIVGDLAESWEQPDAKTLIFKLRQGVTFHDGTPFDAEVAAWNMLRVRDHAKSQWKTQLAVLESAEALNKSTLRLSLKTPSPGFLRSMGYASGARVYMVSKGAMDKLGEDGFNRTPVGTGAFRFKQWITDDRLILERNPNYFEMGADGKPLPYLDGFVGRFVPDPTVALVDMRAGAVHLVEWVATKDVAAIKADPNLVLYELPWAGQNYFKVGFNAKAAPFNDVRVRQAALMAIDRAGMAKALGFGVGVPHYYPFWLPRTLGYDESITKNEYNPAKVKELLAAAGHPNGISIELKVIAREPENTIGEFAQQMWSAVGIKTKLVSLERLAWIDAVRANNFQAAFWRGVFQTVVDPDVLKTRIMCGAPANWAQVCDPDIDRLMNEGGATLDPRKRHEIYRNVLRLVQERAYLGTGIVMPLLMAYRKEVQGLTFNFQVPHATSTWLAK
jgi:peptide/nickel transport system substrate-binding protein